MENLLPTNQAAYFLENLNASLQNKNRLAELQLIHDQSEKEKVNPFHSFSDTDMILWFLYESKHLDESRGRSARTTISYRREIEQFLEFLLLYSADIGIDVEAIVDGSLFKSLQPRHIKRYQRWLSTSSPYVQKNGPYSVATLERKTTVLKNFFRAMYDAQYIKEALHQGFKIVRTKSDDRPNRDMFPKDVVRVLDEFKKTENLVMFTIIHILVTTGLRNEEFCRLKVKDLRYDSISERYYLAVEGKGNKHRDVPLKEKVVRSIHLFREVRGLPLVRESKPDSPLFTTRTGAAYSPSYFSQMVKKEIAKLPENVIESNVNVTPHVFRHAFAIISHVNRVDVYDIMRSLGHEKIETTMIYLEKRFELDQHAINQWKSATLGDYI